MRGKIIDCIESEKVAKNKKSQWALTSVSQKITDKNEGVGEKKPLINFEKN